jgi:hypothetical protein
VSEEIKNVLMIARHKKIEALRMASGLTLLDDIIKVAVIGDLDREDPDVEMQMDSLDFAEVPVVNVDINSASVLAQLMVESDVVYVL